MFAFLCLQFLGNLMKNRILLLRILILSRILHKSTWRTTPYYHFSHGLASWVKTPFLYILVRKEHGVTCAFFNYSTSMMKNVEYLPPPHIFPVRPFPGEMFSAGTVIVSTNFHYNDVYSIDPSLFRLPSYHPYCHCPLHSAIYAFCFKKDSGPSLQYISLGSLWLHKSPKNENSLSFSLTFNSFCFHFVFCQN